MKTLKTALMLFCTAINLHQSLAAAEPDLKKEFAVLHNEVVAEVDGILLKSKSPGDVLRKIEGRIPPESLIWLRKKTEKSLDSPFKISRRGPGKYSIAAGKSVMSFELPPSLGEPAKVNNRTLHLEPSDTVETMWDKAISLMPVEQSRRSPSLWVPEAHALFFVVFPIIAGAAIVGTIAAVHMSEMCGRFKKHADAICADKPSARALASAEAYETVWKDTTGASQCEGKARLEKCLKEKSKRALQFTTPPNIQQ